MLVITTKIKRKEKVRLNGPMVGCIKVRGKTVNSMAAEISKIEKAMSKWVNGMKVKEYGGMMKTAIE